MKPRIILLYWLLLLVPTVVISIGAIRMLKHEQERFANRQERFVRDRARAAAEDLQVLTSDVQDELMAGLRRIDPAEPVDPLLSWKDRNPLIRNVFAWHPDRGLDYPPRDGSALREEQHFVERYAPLFEGRRTWQSASVRDVPAGKGAEDDVTRRVSAFRTKRLALREAVQYDSAPQPRSAPSQPGGWIPWFEGNRLGYLAWVEDPASGRVYGIELEFSALLSRLVTLVTAERDSDLTLALFDDAGQVAHQAGPAMVEPDSDPVVIVSLAPELPHWEIRAFSDSRSMVSLARGFFLLALLVLGIFVVGIFSGGGLLTWQAVRNWRDSLRKTTFVSNVSHELKTPLTSIRMYAELLNEKRVPDETKRTHYLNVIATEAQRLTRLVNNMLDFSRLEQRRKHYRPETLDVACLLREFAENQRLRLREAGMTMDLEGTREPVMASTDRDALEQVLLNLLDNAVKYAQSGQELSVELRRTDARVEIHVLDRGPGIPRGHHEKIFEKFHRVDDSLTAEQPGSGLGLSIARSLMRGVGGDVLYRPREGGGCDFIIVLDSNDQDGPDTGSA